VTPEVTAQLLATASHKLEGEGILATQLCSHMQDANLINTSKLNNLTGVLSAVLPTLHTSTSLF
jgi:ATP-dependent DNA helicase PIF1